MLQKLSPQQIQLMKLLQIPTATLEQRIKEELEANPALDEGDEEREEMEEFGQQGDEAFYENGDGEEQDFAEGNHEEDLRREDSEFEFEDYISDYIEDDPASYQTRGDSYSGEEDDKTIPIAVENTFHEYLGQQLGLLNLQTEREEKIAKQIIGSIDDDGYLRRDVLAIVDDLVFAQNLVVTEEEVLFLLKKIQRFDPPGIGARSLQECLILQLHYKYDHDEELTHDERVIIRLAIRLLTDLFDEFTKKHYPRLQRQLGVSEEELREANDLIIKQLNPKPASAHVSSNDRASQYVVPDFIIEHENGELELTLHSRNAPDLRVNEQYKDMLRAYKINRREGKTKRTDREAVMFIKQKIDSAKWFIDAIRQRQETMYKTMFSIMDYQYEFFRTGDQKKLRPMILKDIADGTGLDISTVSRVANSKFVQTEFGTRRLKDFFSESLQTDNGEEVSTLEVKKILTDIIGDENKKKPYSDEKLKSMLQKKGYNIARRTVAKYREQLNVPVARLRKAL